nr:response regulator [Planctomycetota bacterium]
QPVHVDRDMWEKIVLNLLSNAFKHTFAGAISVALREVRGGIELRIADTGIGIPVEQQPRLFERFHRVQGARSRTHEGSGIGLALVQELVKLHGGTVRVESEVGRGSVFIVALPTGTAHLPADQIAARQDNAAPARARDESFAQEALRWLPDGGAEHNAPEGAEQDEGDGAALGIRPRIILADDNADMRDYVRRLLASRWRVEVVADGAAALAAARAEAPDLILSDVMMPNLDGFGLIRALRADQALKHIPVILLSARAGEDASIDGLEAGADDYLIKPFSAPELLARVAAQLQTKRVREEATREVRESREHLRLALASARMIAWSVDIATSRIRVLENASDILGLPPGRSLDEMNHGLALIHPEDRVAHAERIKETIANGGSYRAVFRIVRPIDGRVIWVEEQAGVQRNQDGRVQLSGVTTDISERRRSEIALSESEGRFRDMADSAPVMVWVTEPRDRARVRLAHGGASR